MKGAKSYSDAEIIQIIQSGEGIAGPVSYLYKAHFDNLAYFIKQNKGNQQDAEDIFQEIVLAFIELVRKERFRGDSSIKTCLYAIGRNLWLNELKKRSRTLIRETEYHSVSPQVEQDIVGYVVAKEALTNVLSLMDKLGEICKKILVYYYYEALSMKEILERMDYETEQVVRNKKYKCMKQLMELLDGNSEVKKTFKDSLAYGSES